MTAGIHSRVVVTGSLVAAAIIAAACSTTTGSSSYYGASSPAASAAPVTAPIPSSTAPAGLGTAINIGTTRLGNVLVDPNGLTVYLFQADKGTVSSCNSQSCMQYWPPVLTTGAPQAGAGVNGSLLGTAMRADGSTQVTYAGHPLYLFASDQKAGDAKGQALNAFGAAWYVVSPSGAQIG